MSIIFYQICINEEKLPINIYIYTIKICKTLWKMKYKIFDKILKISKIVIVHITKLKKNEI